MYCIESFFKIFVLHAKVSKNVCVEDKQIIGTEYTIKNFVYGAHQNRCIYRMGSPPPAGSKNEVLKFRSVRSIVIAAARTGRDRRRRITVTKMAQANKGMRSMITPLCRMLNVVHIKLICT